MGVYLNSRKPYLLFQKERFAPYFVDKSEIINELIQMSGLSGKAAGEDTGQIGGGVKYQCITRPRRFGKTVMASMISAFFEKGVDSGPLFENLAVAASSRYGRHLNCHNVIHIMLNELPDQCVAYDQYMSRIRTRLMDDLIREFPEAGICREEALLYAFNKIIEYRSGEKFIFVLDEWDYIFHTDFVTTKDRMNYISFLSNLLKDQPYVEMVYMTGILPIAKYASGSGLNMFCEYTMASEEKYSGYFGFTETEVDRLYEDIYRADKRGCAVYAGRPSRLV